MESILCRSADFLRLDYGHWNRLRRRGASLLDSIFVGGIKDFLPRTIDRRQFHSCGVEISNKDSFSCYAYHVVSTTAGSGNDDTERRLRPSKFMLLVLETAFLMDDSARSPLADVHLLFRYRPFDFGCGHTAP